MVSVAAYAPADIAAARDAAKGYARIELAGEDDVIDLLAGTALRVCEAFVGQLLIARTVEEVRTTAGEWRRLGDGPVRSVTSVVGLPADGASFVLPVDAYAIDIDERGDGWVRVSRPGAAGRVRVTYQAGLATGWDGAAVRLFAVDWETPDDTLTLARGELGAVSVTGDAFSAELLGPAAVLDGSVVEETSPECRAELGDRRCRIDMAARRVVARVLAIDEDVVTIDRSEPSADAWGWGTLRWIDGANSGLSSAVLSSNGSSVTLRAPPPFAVDDGARVELIEGCDKTLATCSARFGNVANFRGEPHLPGNDLLTRYPGE